MRRSIWQNVKRQLGGAKNKWRRTYVTMTTPAEVKAANELKKQLPTSYASYFYMASQSSNSDAVTLAGYLVLTANLPASQSVLLQNDLTSTADAELAATVEALESVPHMKRQSGAFVIVTGQLQLVKEYNDFSLFEHYGPNSKQNDDAGRLMQKIAELVLTYRNLRIVSYEETDNRKAQFLQNKLMRIITAYVDAKRSK
ncbi:hypothetical protein WOSG25_021400 [Weissella oryzae SG25]|uniref:Uncharacterized protein n=1 Tax=Weissella oryzae (strain DSM 25784 / JCM 18191 / LMG 30913 / SG25) TaxID=1329250 RepID=A0A069CSZ7_WEIOS|nr:hypothetical protein [Weissella oryzae]GAK30343.1 hypothetical protein WOSG25_021400 [Weissella oryzae SG25]